MIRLTRQTDYGIVLLTRIAAAPTGETHNARTLAEQTRLPPPMVSKILKALARAGLLASQRGVKGGYSLARPAAGITVAAMIEALEGPIAMTDCTAPGSCKHEQTCATRGNWQRINQAVLVALESLSLADMTHPIPRGLVNLSPRRPKPGLATLETT